MLKAVAYLSYTRGWCSCADAGETRGILAAGLTAFNFVSYLVISPREVPRAFFFLSAMNTFAKHQVSRAYFAYLHYYLIIFIIFIIILLSFCNSKQILCLANSRRIYSFYRMKLISQTLANFLNTFLENASYTYNLIPFNRDKVAFSPW